jgi:hypothetical protein
MFHDDIVVINKFRELSTLRSFSSKSTFSLNFFLCYFVEHLIINLINLWVK